MKLTAITNRAILPIQLIFLLNSFGISLWVPRIPDVKAALGLDLFTLSLCLLAMPLGTLLGFTFAPAIIWRLGQRMASLAAGSIFLIVFILPSFAWNAWSLGGALFVSGLAVATIEVAMNAKASQIQEDIGHPIMSRCHGFWSIGSALGGLTGGAFGQAGVAFHLQQLTVLPLLAAATVAAGLYLRADRADGPRAKVSFALPDAALLALAAMPLGAMLAEGTMMDWSAVFAREVLGASPLLSGATFAVFASAMALGRLTGDWVTWRFGLVRTLTVSGILTATGLLAFALPGSLIVAFPASALIGLGIANVYPVAMTIAGRQPGATAERSVAAVALISFCAFLVGPPFIGMVGQFAGLPLALALVAPVGLLPIVLLRTGKLRPE